MRVNLIFSGLLVALARGCEAQVSGTVTATETVQSDGERKPSLFNAGDEWL